MGVPGLSTRPAAAHAAPEVPQKRPMAPRLRLSVKNKSSQCNTNGKAVVLLPIPPGGIISTLAVSSLDQLNSHSREASVHSDH